jgi:membrane protease subunit HflC
MRLNGVIFILALVVFVGSFSVFTVDEREKAIRFQLGEIVRFDYTPGFYLQVPFFNNVRKFDSRIQTLDAPAARIITTEKKYVLVDSFVKWRIGDIVKFYKTMGTVNQVNVSLGPVVEQQVRDEFGGRTIQAVVAGERDEVMKVLTDKIKSDVEQYGIEIVDVRVKRVDFEDEISEAVFEQMRTERQRVAQEFRSRGQADAERIKADADRQYTELLAGAYREAQQTRGEGDARAAETYALAYNKNREFYSLYRSLNAYKSSFSNKNDVILLEPDADFFKYFNSPKAKK